MRNFKELEIWKESHKIVLQIYVHTQNYPKKDFLRFCHIAMGSASELEYQLILSYDLKYIDLPDYEQLSNQLIILKKRLNAFIQYLKTQAPNRLKTQKPKLCV